MHQDLDQQVGQLSRVQGSGGLGSWSRTELVGDWGRRWRGSSGCCGRWTGSSKATRCSDSRSRWPRSTATTRPAARRVARLLRLPIAVSAAAGVRHPARLRARQQPGTATADHRHADRAVPRPGLPNPRQHHHHPELRHRPGRGHPRHPVGRSGNHPERPGRHERGLERAAEAANLVVPPIPRWLVDDATPEALAGLLATYGRIALLSPEGDVFDQMAGRYNQTAGPNLGVYLKGHAGDLLKVDRRGRPPEYVERPCLTIGLAVQPEVLRGLASRPGFGGRGLLARFLYSLPASLVGRRQVGAPPVAPAVADRYALELQALASSLAVPAGDDGPAVLTLGR